MYMYICIHTCTHSFRSFWINVLSSPMAILELYSGKKSNLSELLVLWHFYCKVYHNEMIKRLSYKLKKYNIYWVLCGNVLFCNLAYTYVSISIYLCVSVCIVFFLSRVFFSPFFPSYVPFIYFSCLTVVVLLHFC